MARSSRNLFTTVKAEGGLLPPDFLQRLVEGAKGIEGLTPESYHLIAGEKPNEAASRSWNRLQNAWAAFQTASNGLRAEDAGTGLTREKWLLPLFSELGYGRLQPAKTFEIDGKPYPISHLWQLTPIHLVGRNVELDRRSPGVIGAAKTTPHGLMQEFLNRHEGHLWGFVSNGLKLRILRDNKSLTRQAYVEFDLAGMIDGQAYSDFAVLFLLCHQSRVEAERAEQCWLEKWADAAREQGTRALDQLREGVEGAIKALGRGFLAQPANRELVDKLRSGALDKQDYYRQLLRTVYRLIFLFVAEDRDLLLTAPHGSKPRKRYIDHYSASRLRTLAERRRGTPHPDLWHALRLVFAKLSSDTDCPELGLPALGSFLWSDKATPDLDRCELSNGDLLEAIRSLALTLDGKIRRAIDYRNLGAEELGSVYESLLELHPDVNADAPTFDLKVAAGHERKTTGSYYTSTSLIECLLDSALEPVLQEAAKRAAPEKAILDLKVCDPACGSGHFLIAAAHRMANRLAAVRTGDEESSPEAVRKALRDIVGRCLYGVDINPMAVELCKVNLWLEALEPGKPLSFLEHHIQCGNSLLGTTPALLKKGIPDGAFEPLEGDDKAICRILKKKNKAEREGGQRSLLEAMHEAGDALRDVALALAGLDAVLDDTPEGQRSKQARWEELVRSNEYAATRLLGDAWCAAFFWKKTDDSSLPYPITEDAFRGIEKDPLSTPPRMLNEIRTLAGRYRFFHWHMAFPDLFRVTSEETGPGWEGGFDLVLGNPPWETLSPDVKEFFSAFEPRIRFVDKRGQDEITSRLLADPKIAGRWSAYRRDLFGLVAFLKDSGRYKLFAPGNLGKGDFNSYRMFVETALQTTRRGGFTAQVVPAGFYGGANAMAIRKELFEHWDLRLVLGLINTGERWFAGVDQTTRFSAYAARKGGHTDSFAVAFGIRSPEQLAAALCARQMLSVASVVEQSPVALAIPETTGEGDAEIAARMYRRWPKFGDATAGPPQRTYMAEVHMGNDRWRFADGPPGLPVYEGRMVDQFDHRAKAYRSGRGRAAVWEELGWSNPQKTIGPQWYVPLDKLPEKVAGRVGQFRIGFCDVTAPRNERSLLAALIPPGTVCGHKVPSIVFPDDYRWAYMVWLAVANSFCIDFLVRKKVALAMSFTVLDSVPFPRLPLRDPLATRLGTLALRLTCTSLEMVPYWNSMAQHGWCEPAPPDGPPPGLVTEEDRAVAKAEIDAVVAQRVFDLSRAELAQVLDTFPIVRRRDEERFGEFRTKRLTLGWYDAVQAEAAPLGSSLGSESAQQGTVRP